MYENDLLSYKLFKFGWWWDDRLWFVNKFQFLFLLVAFVFFDFLTIFAFWKVM